MGGRGGGGCEGEREEEGEEGEGKGEAGEVWVHLRVGACSVVEVCAADWENGVVRLWEGEEMGENVRWMPGSHPTLAVCIFEPVRFS